ncbi:MAG: CrcB family protein [Oceanipulchritudo sp.]
MQPPRLSLRDCLAIGLGGMLGSLLRSWIGTGFEGSFPIATLLVNILGTAALGILHASRHRLDPGGRYLYMVGFCGSFTTVSLFSLETLSLLREGHLAPALVHLGLPVLVSLLLVIWIITKVDPRPGKDAS